MDPLKLWYDRPAANGNETLPQGNGRLWATEMAKGMQGPYTEAYMPMADLWVEFPKHENVSSYKRELDLRTAVSKISYECGGALWTRETFVSHPDNLVAIHLTSSRPGSLAFNAKLSCKLHFKIAADKKTSSRRQGA